MAVKLELYRVFKEVAESGNISVAAKNLYISQSAVSQSIKTLEKKLNHTASPSSSWKQRCRRGSSPAAPGASLSPARDRCSISMSAAPWG